MHKGDKKKQKKNKRISQVGNVSDPAVPTFKAIYLEGLATVCLLNPPMRISKHDQPCIKYEGQKEKKKERNSASNCSRKAMAIPLLTVLVGTR